MALAAFSRGRTESLLLNLSLIASMLGKRRQEYSPSELVFSLSTPGAFVPAWRRTKPRCGLLIAYCRTDTGCANFANRTPVERMNC